MNNYLRLYLSLAVSQAQLSDEPCESSTIEVFMEVAFSRTFLEKVVPERRDELISAIIESVEEEVRDSTAQLFSLIHENIADAG